MHNIDGREGPKITPVHFNNVEMNGVRVIIVSQMAQLVINYFEAKPHPQKRYKMEANVNAL